MAYIEDHDWSDAYELLASQNADYCVLEEEIDVDTQREFMRHLDNLVKKNRLFKKKQSMTLQEIPRLDDPMTSDDEKKDILLMLSTLDDIHAYRTIEAFQRRDTPIKGWATIALQQSRMLIQTSLTDENTIYVSTGLGGKGQRLRYFCALIAQNDAVLQPFQQSIVLSETGQRVTEAGGEIEQHAFYEHYITLTLLVPLATNLKNLFQDVIDECNTYGNFLRKKMIITNVKKLSEKEITDILAHPPLKSSFFPFNLPPAF